MVTTVTNTQTKPMKVAPKTTLIEAFQRAVECTLLSDDLSNNAESIRPWLTPYFWAVPKTLLSDSVKRVKDRRGKRC